MAGQNEAGGWTYNCPKASKIEEQWLTDLIKQSDAKKIDPHDKEKRRKVEQDNKNEPPRLPFEIQEQLRQLRMGLKPAVPPTVRMPADNSNTQFATLAVPRDTRPRKLLSHIRP